MRVADFELTYLAELLTLPLADERLIRFLGSLASRVERAHDSYYAFLELPEQGVDIVFNDAPWVIPPEKITDEKALHLVAFHFHRAGHEDYSGYTGRLPGDIAFGDSEFEIRRKLGEPSSTGGGGISSVAPKLPIPRWRKYRFGDAILHLQLDDAGRLEMATLQSPKVRPTPG